jgi:E3 ubiquitin-protein ligase UBR4
MPKTRKNLEGKESKTRSIAWLLPSMPLSEPSSSRAGPPSLPLLEGLSRRLGESDRIVKDLFSEWRAANRIACAIGLLWKMHKTRIGEMQQKKKRQRGKGSLDVVPPTKRRKRGDKKLKDSQPLERDYLPVHDNFHRKVTDSAWKSICFENPAFLKFPSLSINHWLLGSLVSTSLPERQVASKILAQGCPLDQTSIWNCLGVLCSIVYNPKLHLATSASNAVGCIAFLKHVVVNVLSDVDRLAFCHSNAMGLSSICDTLWKLALSAKQGNSQQSQATLRVCFCFEDLLYSITLKGHPKSAPKIHKMLWCVSSEGQNPSLSSSGTSFRLQSPLACLVATYHLWNDLPKNKTYEHYTGLLKRLIDPGVLPDVYPDERKTDPIGARDDLDRLSTTFGLTKSKKHATTIKNDRKQSPNGTDGEVSNSARNEGGLGSPSAADVVSTLESSNETRSTLESVSRYIGSLFGSDGQGGDRGPGQEIDGDGNHFNGGREFQAMNETDDEDAEDDDEDEIGDDEAAQEDEEIHDMNVDENEQSEEHASSEEEINQEEDEEIESDDEDDEGEDMGGEEDADDDDEEEDEVMIHDDDLPELEEGLLEIQRGLARQERLSSSETSGGTENTVGLKERSQVYVHAAMEVLMIQYPNTYKASSSIPSPLSLEAEASLLSSVLKIVKPEKKPFDGKICLRRAPTQEEFFRGNLSRNPVSISMLNPGGNGNQNEPTVRDLRQYIANELQMGDSAELLELLIANKILDVDLKLRVINQTVWKDHCIRLSNSSSGSTLSSLFGGGRESRGFSGSSSGISLLLSSSFARSFGASSFSAITTADSPELLPPMMMTYRLIGVDGEATEDSISSLNDPEAPSASASPAEIEELMEREFGNTRALMKGRGHVCLMRSLERHVSDTLRKIRRDDVDGSSNLSRDHFNHSVFSGLSLILCSAKLSSNRRLLLNSRAPTTLLRLLLDVLHSLEGGKGGMGSKDNPTAKGLQELIEILASDISRISDGNTDSSEEEEDDDVEEDASTLRLLIQGIEASSLSPPLRNNIAKLLPYLTYGKAKLSKELAAEFIEHVDVRKIGEYENGNDSNECLARKSVLMDTFIHASSSLPANEVCDSLRTELLNCGFVKQIVMFIIRNSPTDPPYWSASLWPKETHLAKHKQKVSSKQWLEYSRRKGLISCFSILIGLSRYHLQTQKFVGNFRLDKKLFVELCHWLEVTSDSNGISIKRLALLAETLLDHLAECETSVSEKIRMIRKATRDRKKEIAMERRNKALMSMSSFGSTAMSSTTAAHQVGANEPTSSTTARGTAASLFAPVLGLFNSAAGETELSESSLKSSSSPRRDKDFLKQSSKPSWMEEMENLEDETGLVCSVCQEGVKNQPHSLLGLYCYVKRVSLPASESRLNIDGTTLLTILPNKLPNSLQSKALTVEWYESGKAAGNELKETTKSHAIANRRRESYYTTTVSAANAIHVNCHTKARHADRNHPKAPKSEWEGASLRNSRVNCNVILPLVSARSSQVPLGLVEQSLTEHQVAIANLIGVRPKSNLWTILHDIRLLTLRMAYGESLNADCGGGSLLSNSQLLFYQLSMAKSFDSEAQVDSPASSIHARALSSAFLAACDIISADDYNSACAPSLIRAIADSSVMAALTCILFHNTKDDCTTNMEISDNVPHPKRRWILAKESSGFLRGFLNCAGCRHALGIHDSGCLSGRSSSAKQSRSTAFAEWSVENENQESFATSLDVQEGEHDKTDDAMIDDFANALRPFVVLYAMMDQISSDFAPNLDDQSIEEAAIRLSQTIVTCQRSKNIHELMKKANVTLTHREIMKELQRGMTAA